MVRAVRVARCGRLLAAVCCYALISASMEHSGQDDGEDWVASLDSAGPSEEVGRSTRATFREAPAAKQGARRGAIHQEANDLLSRAMRAELMANAETEHDLQEARGRVRARINQS